MITNIKINGFKSFVNFEMEFTPFTIIAGANASGKSNLFDALTLLSKLAVSDLKVAFNEQRGEPDELFTKYDKGICASEMSFVVEMLVNQNIKDKFGGEKELKYTRLRYELTIHRSQNNKGFEDLKVIYEKLEIIKQQDDKWFKKYVGTKQQVTELWRPKLGNELGKGRRGTPYIDTQEDSKAIVISQDGQGGKRIFSAVNATQTILSTISAVDFPHAYAAKEEMKSWLFLQLSPEVLREPTKKTYIRTETIGHQGENLAYTLFRIKEEDPYSLKEISRRLNLFLPSFTDVDVKDDTANNQYVLSLKTEDGNTYSSRVLSEGTLRILALCILLEDSQHTGLLCFEEPENGVHPKRIPVMIALLRDLCIDFNNGTLPLRQVIVNTHSPAVIKEVTHMANDKLVSVWFSKLNSFIGNINDVKRKVKITRPSKVDKDGQGKLALDNIDKESERKYTLVMLNDYLTSVDLEDSKE